MSQREEKINALLLDNRFVDWVVNPQSPYAEYWLQWISVNAENAALAEETKNFLLELRNAEYDAMPEINDKITEEMLMHIRNAIDMDALPVPTMEKQTSYRRYWVAAAAITSFMLLLSIAFFKKTDRQLSLEEPAKEIQPLPEVIRYNGSNRNELVFLPDGSKVTLAQGSRISYNRLMNGTKRNVSLTGEAFFDVENNPEKPFYIHTPNMVIKVLGTSFRVNASAGKESVAVKTGKVSVYLKGQDLEQSAVQIVMPKQVCTYSISAKELITADYTGGLKIEMETEEMSGYNFEDASLDTVLKTLEKMYSLPVHYDKQKFKDCFITISLDIESLEEKLEVITKTVSASFSISEYGINIEGNGCQSAN